MAALGMGHINPLANEIFDLSEMKDMRMTDPEWMPLYTNFANRVLAVLAITAVFTIVEETFLGLLYDSLMTSLGLFLVSLHAMSTTVSPLCSRKPCSRLIAYIIILVGFSFPRVIRCFREHQREYLMLSITSLLGGALSLSAMFYVMEKVAQRQSLESHGDVQQYKQFLMKLFGTTPFYMLQAFSIIAARTQAVFHFRAYCEILPGAYFLPLYDWKAGMDEVGNCSSHFHVISQRLQGDSLQRMRLEAAWQKFHRSELLWFTRTVIGAEMFYLFWTAMLLGPNFAKRWKKTKEYMNMARSSRLISEKLKLQDEAALRKTSSLRTEAGSRRTGILRKMRLNWLDKLICMLTGLRFVEAVSIGVYDWSGAASYALHILLTSYACTVVVACFVLALASERAVAKAVREQVREEAKAQKESDAPHRITSVASAGLAIRDRIRWKSRARATKLGRSSSEEELDSEDLEQSVPLNALSARDRWKWASSKVVKGRKAANANQDDEAAGDDDGGCDDGGGGD